MLTKCILQREGLVFFEPQILVSLFRFAELNLIEWHRCFGNSIIAGLTTTSPSRCLGTPPQKGGEI